MNESSDTKGLFFAGVDSGSWTTKAVVIDRDARVLGRTVVRSAADLSGAAQEALASALGQAGCDRARLAGLRATGFGRDRVDGADGTRTELDCHARGVRHYVSGALTIVDVGGQDAKVIRLDEAGRRITHRMNRKCAAGTGSFLDEMAMRLGVPTDRLPELAAGFREEVELGSFCTVFSATELLAAIRQGKRPADLARAAYKSVVKRVLEMELFEGRVVATGGVVAHHPMVVDLLRAALGGEVILPPHPQEMGAFGAALVALEAAGEAGAAPRGGTLAAGGPAGGSSGDSAAGERSPAP